MPVDDEVVMKDVTVYVVAVVVGGGGDYILSEHDMPRLGRVARCSINTLSNLGLLFLLRVLLCCIAFVRVESYLRRASPNHLFVQV